MSEIGVQSVGWERFASTLQGDGSGRAARAARREEIPEPELRDARRIDGKALTRHRIACAAGVRAAHLSKGEIRHLLDSVLNEIARVLATGEAVKLHGFGVFSVRRKSQRSGRNPRTGASALIKARKVIVFKASEKMKEAVNGR